MQIRELSPELAEKAKRELNEDPARIKDDLQAIKEWLAKQPHINARTDDQWLIGFLRGCKYSLDRTKEKLDTFYTMKTIIPEIALCMDPMEPDIQELLSLGTFLPLPKSEKADEPRVILVRPGIWKTKNIPVLTLMCLNQMILCLQLKEDDRSVVAGQHYLVDWSYFNKSHFSQTSIAPMKKLILYRQNGFPIRGKGSHHIHNSGAMDMVISLIKVFLNEKAKSRIHSHGENFDSLYKHIPKSILPTEYGGNGGGIQEIIDYWKKKIEDNRQWFIDDKLYKTDESKRIGQPKSSESVFGTEGSFRQLEFD